MIVIVDYGMGNAGSIANMLKKIDAACHVSAKPVDIAAADKLILPGVGAFDAAMTSIEARGLRGPLERRVQKEKVPVLGICLGMQLLTESSEEGVLPGLGWIPARTLAFRNRIETRFKVPHMGWNTVAVHMPSSLTSNLLEMMEPRFYFVHSYYVQCSNTAHSILRTSYGLTFDSAVQMDNVYGVQFHPEKSHRFGMRLLQSFANI